MVYAFDTLSYARHLKERGVPQEQAEAHADAARQFIMAELVTKTDLQNAFGQLDGKITAATSQLDAKLDTLGLRLTVRLGVMLVAALGILATLQKLL